MRERERRLQERAHLVPPEPLPCGTIRNGRRDLPTDPRGHLRQEHGPEEPGQLRVNLVARLQVEPGARRRHEDETRRARRPRHRVPKGHEAAKRHAAQHRAVDSELINHAVHLAGQSIEAGSPIEAPARLRLTVERERDGAALRGQRLESRFEILPSSLDPGDEHHRHPVASLDNRDLVHAPHVQLVSS